MTLVAFDSDAERALLSNWVCNEKFRMAFTLDAGLFRSASHAEIAKALATIHGAGLPVTEGACLLELQRSGRIDRAGGLDAVSDVLNNTPTAADPWRVVDDLKRHLALVRLRAGLDRALQTIEHEGNLDTAKEMIADALRESVSGVGVQLSTVKSALELALKSATTKFEDDADVVCKTNFEELDRALGWLRRKHVWVVGGVTNWGKCLGPDVLVRMFDGKVKAARDVAVGDMLMGPDTKPRRVASLARGTGPMFRIVPRRGTPWTCNWCHVLTVFGSKTGEVLDIELDEFLRCDPSWQSEQQLFHGGLGGLGLTDIAEHDPDRTGFSIEPVGEGPFCGWTLSGDPHFMLGDFTVTHNTSFAVAIADEVMSQGKRALIVGNEDPEELYGRRLLARRSGVSAARLRDRNMSDAEIKAAVDVVAMAKPDPLYLDAVGRYAEDVASDVASLCASEGIDLVIFDYMQKARSRKNHQDRRTELSYIRDLYGDTSKRANACSFQLTQLTGVKDGERPGRENIRDCKDLAHGAEYVLFGWTPPDSEERLLYVDKAKDGAKDVDFKIHWDSHSASFLSRPKRSYEPEFDDFGGGWER